MAPGVVLLIVGESNTFRWLRLMLLVLELLPLDLALLLLLVLLLNARLVHVQKLHVVLADRRALVDILVVFI